MKIASDEAQHVRGKRSLGVVPRGLRLGEYHALKRGCFYEFNYLQIFFLACIFLYGYIKHVGVAYFRKKRCFIQAENFGKPIGYYFGIRNFVILFCALNVTRGYENSPNAEPLDADNPKSEKVIKLILSRKNSSEGFRYIRLAISPKTKLIRRVQATSANTEEDFIFNFSNYTLNNSIPDTRFLYDTPSDANTYDNFLFSE